MQPPPADLCLRTSPNYQNRTAVADAFAAAGLGGSPLAPAAAKLVQIHPRLQAPPIACGIIPIFHCQELGHQPEQPSKDEDRRPTTIADHQPADRVRLDLDVTTDHCNHIIYRYK
jgi:hypothetical protein